MLCSAVCTPIKDLYSYYVLIEREYILMHEQKQLIVT